MGWAGDTYKHILSREKSWRFNNNHPISLRDISIRQGISLVYLEQLFLKLKKNEIVKSIRGKKGGYTLN